MAQADTTTSDEEDNPYVTGVPDHLQAPHDSHGRWLLRRLWDRLNARNEHFMGCIVGQEGSGKSHTAIKIASEIDPNFSHERVMFDVAEFLEVLKEGDFEQGAVFVLDEAGVSMGRRTWQDRSQVLANQALQLIRSENVGVIFTLPRLSELDSQTQGRLQWFYEITEKEDGEYVRGKWKYFDPDRSDDTGILYKKYPRRRLNGDLTKIRSFAFAPPRDELVDAYEDEKTAFQKEAYEEAMQELRGEDGDTGAEDEDEWTDPIAIAEDILDSEDGVGAYLYDINGGSQTVLDKDKIQMEYGVGRHRSRKVKKRLLEEVDIDVA